MAVKKAAIDSESDAFCLALLPATMAATLVAPHLVRKQLVDLLSHILAPSSVTAADWEAVFGEIARALNAAQLIFLTDVDGLLDGGGQLAAELAVGEHVERQADDGVAAPG